MNLDNRLNEATNELRDRLDHGAVPPFEPSRQIPTAAAALAVVIALFAGAAGYGALINGDDPSAGQIVVASPGQIDDPGGTEASDVAEPSDVAETSDVAEAVTDDNPVDDEADASVTDDAATQEPGAAVQTAVYTSPTRLTNAAPGEFIAPLELGSAWNANNSLVLLYRTGANGAAHIIVDASTGDTIDEFRPAAPDIEQVYWNPLNADEVLWFQDDQLRSRNVRTTSEAIKMSLDPCDRLLPTRLPSGPSATATLIVPCQVGTTWNLVIADLAASTTRLVLGAEAIAAVTSDGRFADGTFDALVPSPSGAFASAYSPNGSISVLDVTLGEFGPARTLDSVSDTWVVLPDGTEAIASGSYEPELLGTIVVSWPAPAESVIVGPDGGYDYPPPGTRVTATTGSPGVGQTARVVATVRGTEGSDSGLTGQIVIATIDPTASAAQPVTATIETLAHNGADLNGEDGHWSTNTVSISPDGSRLVWATDDGTDSTNTYIVDLP